ncbi:hypothetical protein TL16_g01241 [Triparma laevis f. inornata]|uniref:Uncharacterized protein n=1 Tax=Triparma laevis f. inornata TaxID=1714386 RepID=A0A9W6ZJL6_9STRA|nr:hypothetical protein TL16_g01241 [Triparma laevis f. inornata]
MHHALPFGQTYKEYLDSDLMSWPPSNPTSDPTSTSPIINGVHVIGYKPLKKRIKRLNADRILNGDEGEVEELVREMEGQSVLVERTFISRYNQICQQKLESENAGQQQQQQPQAQEDDKNRPRSNSFGGPKLTAQQLVMFARMNAVALRKIVKKLSKRLAAIKAEAAAPNSTSTSSETDSKQNSPANPTTVPPPPPPPNSNENNETNSVTSGSDHSMLSTSSPSTRPSSPPLTTISLSTPISSPTSTPGHDLVTRFRKTYKFAGMERHMQELVAFALLEKLGVENSDGDGDGASPTKRTASNAHLPHSDEISKVSDSEERSDELGMW